MPDAPLHDIDAVRAIEARAAARLGDASVLMERAGLAAWQLVLARWPAAETLVVLCGPGNNGGDGYELARHALESGRKVTVVRVPGHAPRSPLAIRAAARFAAAGGSVAPWSGRVPHADLVVDAVFGIGLAGPADPSVAEMFTAVGAANVPVLALDVPSGVDAHTAAVPGGAIRADATIEFLVRKRGLATGAALDHVGECLLADLGVSEVDFAGVTPSALRLDGRSLSSVLPRRLPDSHKGDHGRVLCLGGDVGHGGAILLTAEAALRTGAGLVDVATRAQHVAPMLGRRPEAMALAVDEEEEDGSRRAFADRLEAAHVLAVGPGLGQAAWGRALFEAALRSGKPLVVDADALTLLAATSVPLPEGCILTPHPGEAARLLDTDARTIQRDRFDAARALALRFNAVVVLKGAGTIVAAPGVIPRVIGAGNPGMAVGGMGDVLTGVVASLLAQGLLPFDAASMGALLHALAGDAAVQTGGPVGLLPSDLMGELRRLRNVGWGQ